MPPGPSSLVGRQAQIGRLDELLSRSDSGTRSALVLVRGMAGVGKTALALHWAHAVDAQFPDGQLYANMRGFDSGGVPVSAEQAMRQLLGSTGRVDERLPDDFAALQGWYRGAFAGRRFLILLDNVRDAGQVRPLLPATAGCLVLVTSRSLLSGLVVTDGAALVDVEVLPEAAAHELLSARLGDERVGREADAVTELLGHCAGLPLALAVLSARAAEHPAFPLSSLVAQLRQAPPRDIWNGGDALADLHAVFACSFDALSPAAARLFALLTAYCGAQFSAAEAASAAGLAQPEAGGLLTELARVHLIVEREPGRYMVHDLLYAFGRTRSQEGVAGAAERMIEYYVHSAAAANALLRGHTAPEPIASAPLSPEVTVECFADRAETLRWFGERRTALLAAVGRAQSLGLYVHSWQLAWNIRTYLDWYGYAQERIDALSTALESAVRAADSPAQGRIHRVLAFALLNAGYAEEAWTHSTIALRIFTDLGDVAGQARVRYELALLASEKDDQHEALRHVTSALDLYEQLDDTDGTARTLNAAGWITGRLGDHRRALVLCERALALLELTPHYPEYAYTLDSIGHQHEQLGDLDAAIAYYQRALTALDTASDRMTRAEIVRHLDEATAARG